MDCIKFIQIGCDNGVDGEERRRMDVVDLLEIYSFRNRIYLEDITAANLCRSNEMFCSDWNIHQINNG